MVVHEQNTENNSSQKRVNFARDSIRLITPDSLHTQYPNYPIFDVPSHAEFPETSTINPHVETIKKPQEESKPSSPEQIPALEQESDSSDDTVFSFDTMFSKEELQGLVSIIEIGTPKEEVKPVTKEITNCIKPYSNLNNSPRDEFDIKLDQEFIKSMKDSFKQYLPAILSKIETGSTKDDDSQSTRASEASSVINEAKGTIKHPEKELHVSFDFPNPDKIKTPVNRAWKKTRFYRPSRCPTGICSDSELNRRTLEELRRKAIERQENGEEENISTECSRLVKFDDPLVSTAVGGFLKRTLSSRAGRYIKRLHIVDEDGTTRLRPYTELKESSGMFPQSYDDLLFYYLRLAHYNTSYNRSKFSMEGISLRRQLIKKASLKIWKSLRNLNKAGGVPTREESRPMSQDQPVVVSS